MSKHGLTACLQPPSHAMRTRYFTRHTTPPVYRNFGRTRRRHQPFPAPRPVCSAATLCALRRLGRRIEQTMLYAHIAGQFEHLHTSRSVAQVVRSGVPIRPRGRALLLFRDKHDAQQEPSKGTAHTPRTLRIHFTMCKSHVFRNCQLTATRRNTSTARTITLPKRNTAGTQHGASPCQLAWPTAMSVCFWLCSSLIGCRSCVAAASLPQPGLHRLPIRAGSPPTRAAAQGRRHHGGGGSVSSSAASHLHVGGRAANPGERPSQPTPGPRLARRASRAARSPRAVGV